MNISDWIKRHAIFSPEKVALRTPDRSFTYPQLETQIEAIARVLKWKLGVGQGDRVAFLSHNCPEFLLALMACARIGAIFVPLNWRLTVPEHLYILQNAGVKALLLQETFATRVAPVAKELPHCRIVGLDYTPVDGVGWDSLLTTAQRDEMPDSHTPYVDLTCPLLIVYTSGTTGYPKGAVHTQDAVQWNAINNLHLNDLTSADHILTVLPLFHVGGFNVQTLPAFYCGATVTLHTGFDPNQTLTAISVDMPTVTHLVPSMMRACIQSPLWDQTDFTNLRTLLTGTTIIPQALCDAFRAKGVQVAELYGATETGPIAIYKRPGCPQDKSTSIGVPALHCTVRVVDADGNDQPTGEEGELLIKGANVMLGYWENEAATTQALRNKWYYTGDVGYRDEDGYYFICDRKKNVIIKGGENIYPAEVERVLNTHPDLLESAVVGMPDEQWQEIPVAVVVPRDKATLSIPEIKSFLADKLAAYKIPHDVVSTDVLPKNAMGKLQHFRVREELMQRAELATQLTSTTREIPPLPTGFRERLLQTPMPQRHQLILDQLRSVIADALGGNSLDEIDPQTGWLELGINSLMLIELHHVLVKGIGQSLPITLFFDYPTVEVLVEYLLAEIVVDHSAMASAEDDVAATVGEKETLRGDLEDADGASDLDAFAKQFAKQLDIDWEESAG